MEKIVLFLFLNVFSSLADVWCFFKISRVRSKKRQILFLCIANIFLGLLLSIGNIGVRDCKIFCVRMNNSLNLFLKTLEKGV
ncbi:histidine kinase, partial [Lactobacillus crispatus]|nr:histidine kinase [Lactobacillus crispatus]MCZ3644459.1 histidine kinase [Lactobacillus crispatus]MCZ3646765.1 histidine kinase [Lactobacillus crispatus]MCZ3649447.1 histidine kinase [Lactobacillus crispatus]MCZ3651787.1 histidine kinase [Lactobacillus crispatus]